ncbi:response regulator transcription factor [Candidatus Lucifugimonas marina]|uniref:response regulator transcription factor n=1 Tax=Candidatus Lucifugimonas marina TaxID=3038979 RepID=UPI00319E4CF1
MGTNSKTAGSKILIAEDAADLREALTEVLLDLDYNVKAARDGFEATQMFTEFDPDLAILDMRMPMMNGSDVCSVIRKSSDIPIIMFTSADDVADVNGAILKGASDFVLKTTGMDELADRVEAHLLKKALHSNLRLPAEKPSTGQYPTHHPKISTSPTAHPTP